MEKDDGPNFAARYQSELNANLNRKPSNATTARAALKLGREAAAGGLDPQQLVRIHFDATQALRLRSPPANKGETSRAIEANFLIDALYPIEKQNLSAQSKLQRTLSSVDRKLQRQTKHYDKLLKASLHQQEQARTLAHQFLQAQEEDRKEISRDLHDEIAQVLAGINVRLAALKKISQLDRYDFGQRIDQTQKLVEQSVAAVHRYALRLRPSLLDDLGLIPSLRSFIKNNTECDELNIQLKSNSNVNFLSNEQRTALYRVAQEALTNVTRHAKAKQVTVSIQKLAKHVRMVVWDDGRSFKPQRILNAPSPKRLGLLDMRERIEMIGGVFSIVSTRVQGTSIIAEIPIQTTPTKSTP